MSYGTFGMWGALFAGGETLMPISHKKTKEYLEIDPSDKNSQNRFIKAYRIKDTEQIMDANLPFAPQPPTNATH